MKKLLVIGLLLGSQVNCTSPTFRKNLTKSQLQRRQQQNEYRKQREIVRRDEIARFNKNDTSILSTIKKYTYDQKIATGIGTILLGSGFLQAYWGYQALTQGTSPRMIDAVVWTGLGALDLLRGQNIIVNAHYYKNLHNITRSHIK